MKSMDIYGYLKVKLNAWGIQILKERYDKMCEGNPKMRENSGDFTLPKVDDDGYTVFSLAMLMNIFGPYVETGAQMPFERGILIAESELDDANFRIDPKKGDTPKR